jgi:hypothetical protein
MKDQKHTNVTHGASMDTLNSPEYTLKQNFATGPNPNFCSVNSSDDQTSDHHKKIFRLQLGLNKGQEEGYTGVHSLYPQEIFLVLISVRG